MRKTPRIRQNAFTLVEMLIGLAITALLMTAVAVAFDAALQNYGENRDMGVAHHSVRNVITQMTTNLRGAWNDPDVATIDVALDGNSCSFVTADGLLINYIYRQNTDTIEMNVLGSSNWYVLLRNVQPTAVGVPVFGANLPSNDDFPAGTVGSIDISFTIGACPQNVPVSATVVPRNILYAR